MSRLTDPLLIDLPMPIEMPRLLIRPSRAGDGRQLAEAKRESWAELSRWMDFADGRPVESINAEEDEIYVRKKHSDFILRQSIWLMAFDKAEERLIGTCGYHGVDWKGGVYGTGYWMRTSETGKGYATEVANALIRYAFGALSATRIMTSHADGNIGSQKVIQKLGYVKEGIARRSYMLQNVMVDSHHYARLDMDGLPPLEVTWGHLRVRSHLPLTRQPVRYLSDPP